MRVKIMAATGERGGWGTIGNPERRAGVCLAPEYFLSADASAVSDWTIFMSFVTADRARGYGDYPEGAGGGSRGALSMRTEVSNRP